MKSYIDVSRLPLTKVLQDNHKIIQQECDALFEKASLNHKPNSVSMGQYGRNLAQSGQQMMDGDIYSLYLLLHPDLLDDNEKEIVYARGVPGKRAWRRRQCPEFMRLIMPFFNDLGNVGFNRMMPNSRINPHYGLSTDFFRLHLGITTDPGAKFFLEGSDPYTWTDGGVMAFADGEVLHWVEHSGEKPRTILSIDVRKRALHGL